MNKTLLHLRASFRKLLPTLMPGCWLPTANSFLLVVCLLTSISATKASHPAESSLDSQVFTRSIIRRGIGLPSTTSQFTTREEVPFPSSLPNGKRGYMYHVSMDAGQPAVTYSYGYDPSVGILPPGLVVYSDGELKGIPTTPGTYPIRIVAWSYKPPFNRLNLDYTLVIDTSGCPSATLPTSAPMMVSGAPYNASFAAFPTGAYTYSYDSYQHSLPPGLSFNTTTGELSGTIPSNETPSIQITIAATSSNGCAYARTYSIYTARPCSTPLPLNALPNGKLGVPYTASVKPSGQPNDYFNYNLSKGTLPPGLTINPYSGAITGKPTSAGTYSFTLFVAGGTCYTSKDYTMVIAPFCSATGNILSEMWTNVKGYDVRQIPVTTTPTATRHLTSFEGIANVANESGDRIRGYICPPASGNYTFWIASDDNSVLYLSTDGNAANKQRIAWVNGATQPREWMKFASQQSAPIYLEAGKKYYIESLHKEAYGSDHIAVGWQLPDGMLERPIAGQHLSPVETSNPIGAGTLVYDGINDRATIPVHPAYNVGTGDFTLEAWVTITKSESVGSEGDQIILSNRGNPEYGKFLFMVANQGTRLWFQLNENVFSQPFPTIQDNGCHHIAISRLAGVASFYVDGIYQGSRNLPYSFGATHDIWVGNDAENLDTYATKGGVDEVRIWNKARTRAELAANRKVNVTGQAGLLSYFKFNNEDGQTIVDAGSLANHGFLGDSPLVDDTDPVRAWEACYTPARQASAAQESVETASNQPITAFPNPFAGATTIRYEAEASGKASVAVYDLKGSLVTVLFEGDLQEGETKDLILEGTSLPSGVYLVKSTSLRGVSHLKLVLTK